MREFDLLTGRLRRAFADHRPYAVEAVQLGPWGTPGAGRLVSVDWSGVVACVPSTLSAWRDREGLPGEDMETLVFGRDCTWTTSPPPAPSRNSPPPPPTARAGAGAGAGAAAATSPSAEPIYDLPSGHAGRPLLAESSGGGAAHLRALDLAYRLGPTLLPDARLSYRRLGAREVPEEVNEEATMAPSVCCLAHDGDQVLLGTKHGRVVQLEFGRGAVMKR